MLVWERTESSASHRTLTPARAPGRGGTEATSGRISSEPGPPNPRPGAAGGGGRDFFTVISPGAKPRSWRGAGRGHAPTRTFHARSQLPAQSGLCLRPVPSLPGRCSGAPRRGKGGAGTPRPGGSAAGRSQQRPAIAGRGSRSGARGSAALPRAARRGPAEVPALPAPAAGSPPRTGCSMGGGAARAGQGCSGAVRSRGLGRPRLRRWRQDPRAGEGRPGRRVELDASGQAWASASCASPRRAVRGARGACTGRGSATRQSRAAAVPTAPGPSCRPPASPPTLPPAAHPAGRRPAPRMRPVPPLKGQCVPRALCLPRQVASRTGVSVGSPRTPLSRRREAGAELRGKFTVCQTMPTPGDSGLGRSAVGNFLRGGTSRGPSVLV